MESPTKQSGCGYRPLNVLTSPPIRLVCGFYGYSLLLGYQPDFLPIVNEEFFLLFIYKDVLSQKLSLT